MGLLNQRDSSSSVNVAFALLFDPDAGWGGFGEGDVFGNSQANITLWLPKMYLTLAAWPFPVAKFACFRSSWVARAYVCNHAVRSGRRVEAAEEAHEPFDGVAYDIPLR